MQANKQNDFAALFEAKERQKVRIRPGEKVSGKVIMIGTDTVFIDLGARADGIIDKMEFIDENGETKLAEGDIVEAYCMGWTDEGVKLQLKMKGEGDLDSELEQAFLAKMPVEGKVSGERKGGYTVQISKSEAFCPFSQIDLPGQGKEPADYIGKSFLFRISEFSEEGRNIVLNRRQLLEEEAGQNRQKLRETLQEGDIVNGTVVSLLHFGAFVDIGGVEGLIHVSDLSWSRVGSPEEVLSVGQQVQVKVISLEWGDEEKKERIGLSLKEAGKDPWSQIQESPDYAVGRKRQGIVRRIADFGAFIELEPGVDGLAHISQLGAEQRVEHPSDVLQLGQELEVTILEVDGERRRIGLCVGEPRFKAEPAAELSYEDEKNLLQELIAGQKIEGKVDSQKPYGLFVLLPDGRSGLLHISQIPLPEGGSGIPVRALYKMYPLHSSIEVIIKEINGDRISLTLPETLAKEEEDKRSTPADVKDQGSAGFGNLDDLFANLKLDD
ncbi:MAG: S1 RNA-binding domain-containing protein [Lentisphaeria bacterium]|nr:S1 RNA-binding domain-containing protein [Lentisphaeria bacterium]NLZ60771.1 S1 RNA-binding domain-containing protein [Lentisphaerota bacterium]